MPTSGSQIILCDLPVRFDTYEGCSHACRYCFVNRKVDIRNIKGGESAKSLESFILGNRNQDLAWCDWDIPLHFGGMSDPFQPIEREAKRTLEALRVFEKYQYPFVISTKNKLIAEEPYLSIIKNCNVVVQFSAACPQYDQIEKGASTFDERMDAVRKITPFKRVIIRVQPYIPDLHDKIMESLKTFAEAGAYGITIEGMKYIKAVPGTIRVGNDMCYPAKLLRKKYAEIRDECHALGLRFYCAENRLRNMGDDLCCCGVDGLGWKTNTANVVHMINGGGTFTEGQKTQKARKLVSGINQSTISNEYGKAVTYEQFMKDAVRCKNILKVLIPES